MDLVSELPIQVATGMHAANRNPEAVDALFKIGSVRPTVETILSVLGQPDGFRAQGQTEGGTLRFLLADGGELRVRTRDFHAVYEAYRINGAGTGEAPLEMNGPNQSMKLTAGSSAINF